MNLGELIRKGIPAAGMPAFQLPEREMQRVSRFCSLSIRPRHRERCAPATSPLAPHSSSAREIVSSCHMVKGRGGLLGPDLSELGAERTLSEIEQSLRTPSARLAPGFRVISARLHDGRSIRGLRKKREQLRPATPEPRRKVSSVTTPGDSRTDPRNRVADAGSEGDSRGDARSPRLFEPFIRCGGVAAIPYRPRPQFGICAEQT